MKLNDLKLQIAMNFIKELAEERDDAKELLKILNNSDGSQLNNYLKLYWECYPDD